MGWDVAIKLLHAIAVMIIAKFSYFSGNYTCLASNNVGQETFSAQMIVQGIKFEIFVHISIQCTHETNECKLY